MSLDGGFRHYLPPLEDPEAIVTLKEIEVLFDPPIIWLDPTTLELVDNYRRNIAVFHVRKLTAAAQRILSYWPDIHILELYLAFEDSLFDTISLRFNIKCESYQASIRRMAHRYDPTQSSCLLKDRLMQLGKPIRIKVQRLIPEITAFQQEAIKSEHLQSQQETIEDHTQDQTRSEEIVEFGVDEEDINKRMEKIEEISLVFPKTVWALAPRKVVKNGGVMRIYQKDKDDENIHETPKENKMSESFPCYNPSIPLQPIEDLPIMLGDGEPLVPDVLGDKEKKDNDFGTRTK